MENKTDFNAELVAIDDADLEAVAGGCFLLHHLRHHKSRSFEFNIDIDIDCGPVEKASPAPVCEPPKVSTPAC